MKTSALPHRRTPLALLIGFTMLIWSDPVSGQLWTASSAPNLNWTALAGSADGTKLLSVANDPPNGAVYLSTDSGTNWTPAQHSLDAVS